MLKKTIEYTDYNGNTRKEDFYFNLSMAEIAEMELGTTGGLAEMMQRVVNAQNTPELCKIFKDFILKAYGVKSPDGRRFVKNDEVREDFAQTEAYSNLFIELATDDVAAAAFINGVVPKEISEEMAANNKK